MGRTWGAHPLGVFSPSRLFEASRARQHHCALLRHRPRGAGKREVYSLIETARTNYIEPHAYLGLVFTEIPRATTLEEVEVLLPSPLDCAQLHAEFAPLRCRGLRGAYGPLPRAKDTDRSHQLNDSNSNLV